MCSPYIIAEVDRIVANRRSFLKSAVGSCAAAAGLGVASSSLAETIRKPATYPPVTFSRTVDLTHTLTPDFPAWFTEGEDVMGRTAPASLAQVDEFVIDENTPFALKKVSYWEHVGTHVDAASHCSNRSSVDEIPAEQLVSPLVVIDIRSEAAEDPLAQVTPEHIQKWEAVHGPLPPRCFVAMNSGWSEKIHDRKAFLCPLEKDGQIVALRQPAFHPDTTRMFLEDHDVVGIGVDTLSFDNVRSNSLDVHLIWLPEDRWGVENLKDLSHVPEAGATIVVGAPKFKGGTGGPARVLALV